MGSDAVIYVPSFINIGSGIQELTGGIHRHTHTQTARWSHKPTLFFQNKESRLIKGGLWDHLAVCVSVCLCIRSNSWKPSIFPRQRLGKHVPAARNTHVGGMFYYAVRLVSKESSRLVLLKTSCLFLIQELQNKHQNIRQTRSRAYPYISLSIYHYINITAIDGAYSELLDM
jgi:hypothetical protein